MIGFDFNLQKRNSSLSEPGYSFMLRLRQIDISFM